MGTSTGRRAAGLGGPLTTMNNETAMGIAFTPEQLTAIQWWAAHMRPRGIARVAIEPHHESWEELATVFLRWADGPT